MATPTAFLFDIGNVIISFDFRIAARRIAPFCTVEPEEAFLRVSELTDDLEVGNISPEQFIALASERIGYTEGPQFFRESFEDVFTLNEEVAELIEQIDAAEIPLYLLSNTNGIHVPFFEKTYPVFSRFRGRIYSHEVGVMKPDPAIYQIAIERLGLEPESTVYIDDLAANCKAGREAGLLSIRYTPDNPSQFFAQMVPYLP